MRSLTVREIVEQAYSELRKLQPTPEEIQEFADAHEGEYGVVTYSKSRGGQNYFLEFHDTWKKKFGGRIHIDVGYVDERCVDQWNVPDTTHLMLDKDTAPEFVDFIKKKRE